MLTLGNVWSGDLMEDLEKQQQGTSSIYYDKLCASFQSHWWIQTGVTVRKRSIWVKIGDFFLFVPCELKIWRMTLKTIGHIFYANSSFVHHLIAICELKMESQSGNPQFGSNSAIFLSRVTLKFDGLVWRWKTIRHLVYAMTSFVRHFMTIG